MLLGFINFYWLQVGLLVFWGIWLSIVFITNSFEGLKALGILPESWKFASKNYAMIQQATAKYAVPGWLNTVLFVGVIIWQALAALLFWQAAIFLPVGGVGLIQPAFTVSIALWCAFMIADEIFKAYDNQSEHLLILIGHLASLVVILLV